MNTYYIDVSVLSHEDKGKLYSNFDRFAFFCDWDDIYHKVMIVNWDLTGDPFTTIELPKGCKVLKVIGKPSE